MSASRLKIVLHQIDRLIRTAIILAVAAAGACSSKPGDTARFQERGQASAPSSPHGGNTTASDDAVCRVVQKGGRLELRSPTFVFALDTLSGLASESWENLITGRKIPLGRRPEVEFDLDAADRHIFITGWKMANGQSGFAEPEEEGGFKQGWAAYGFDDSGWYGRTPPASYVTPDSPDLSNYYWARTHVFLPKDARDRDLSLVLGGFGLFDYRYMRVFVNGHEVGTRRFEKRWAEPGTFDLGPKSEFHQHLRFGTDNVVALQLAGYKCRTAHLNALDPEHQRDLAFRYYWPGQFEQYLAVGRALVTPQLGVTAVKIGNGKGECQVRIELAAPNAKFSGIVTYRWNASQPVLHKSVEVRNNSGTEVRLMNVRLGDYRTGASVSEGEQGFPVYIDEQFFAALAHPAGWAIGQDGRVILRHYPGKKLASGETFSCMEAVLGVGQAGGARGVFLDHVKSRMRRVVRGHDKPYSIVDPFGAWPDEDWWGGTETYMLDHIRNVITPEVKESGCTFDFYCLELWRDIKGDIEHPNPKTYPQGFGRIRDELEKQGIRLGLWNDVSGPSSWTCGENPVVQSNATFDSAYGTELAWYCIAEDPLKSMFTQAFINHIRKTRMRLIKMDGTASICYNPNHGHLPGVYSTEAIWNAVRDITNDLDRECPELFIMLYWGCRSPWLLMYGDTLFEPGLAIEAAHPSAHPAPHVRDSITVGLDQAQWFSEDTPKLGKDSLGLWLSRWGWNGGVGKERWQEGMIMDICRGSLLAQPWSDDGSLTKQERRQLADFIALLKERPGCFGSSRFILGNPWKDEPYGYCCTDGYRAFLAINNCTWSDRSLRLELNSAWGLPDGRTWDLYRWYPNPARLTGQAGPFEKNVWLGIRPYEVTLLEVVPAGERPTLGRIFANRPLPETFVEPSRRLDLQATPAADGGAKTEAPPRRTLSLQCRLPASGTGGILVLAVELKKAGLAVNMGGDGGRFSVSVKVSGTSARCETIVPANSFPCPWQGWRVPVGPAAEARNVYATVIASIPVDLELTWQAYFLPLSK